MLALQFQLEQTQWLAADVLARLQLTQLAQVVAHAYETVPHYRERWSGQHNTSIPLTWQAFSRLPLLTRSDLRSRF
ncbi:MAG: hypothetical protein OEV84_09480, partial [Betaproteobacteria bacterium]|nr:hypothetical protein [Betaproteobacteria bacterium]